MLRKWTLRRRQSASICSVGLPASLSGLRRMSATHVGLGAPALRAAEPNNIQPDLRTEPADCRIEVHATGMMTLRPDAHAVDDELRTLLATHLRETELAARGDITPPA